MKRQKAMKKGYYQPTADRIDVMPEEMICVSGVTSPGKGIGYGGVDTNGSKVANSRNAYWDWEDEED